MRKLADGETTDDLFGFLTTTANREVGAIHPKAMPVILTRLEELDLWMKAPLDDALQLQRPMPDNALTACRVGHFAADNAKADLAYAA